jgi:hypothetical protein
MNFFKKQLVAYASHFCLHTTNINLIFIYQPVFLSYSLDHVGYFCLDIYTRQVYVICHCMFDKSSFLYTFLFLYQVQFISFFFVLIIFFSLVLLLLILHGLAFICLPYYLFLWPSSPHLQFCLPIARLLMMILL